MSTKFASVAFVVRFRLLFSVLTDFLVVKDRKNKTNRQSFFYQVKVKLNNRGKLKNERIILRSNLLTHRWLLEEWSHQITTIKTN